MRKAVVIFLVLLTLFSTSRATTFNDVEGSWAKEYIEEAAEYGLFNGYPDGSFLPEKEITRIEYITVINKVLSMRTLLPEIDYSKVYMYPDVRQVTWAENAYSQFMVRANLYGTAADNKYGAKEMFEIFGEKFEPYKAITREEAVAIISLFIKDEEKVGLEVNFNDIGSSTFPESIKLGNKIGIINGYPNGSFKPFNKITRAEASVMLLNFNDNIGYLKNIKRSKPTEGYNEYLEPMDVLKKILEYELAGEFYNSFCYYKENIAINYEKYMLNPFVKAYINEEADFDTFEFTVRELTENEAIIEYNSSSGEYTFSKKLLKINGKWYADFNTEISV